jgi:hypothetical protein
MQWAPSRRRVLATLSSATAAGLIGGARGMAQEAPPETTTVRLAKIPGIARCFASARTVLMPAAIAWRGATGRDSQGARSRRCKDGRLATLDRLDVMHPAAADF